MTRRFLLALAGAVFLTLATASCRDNTAPTARCATDTIHITIGDTLPPVHVCGRRP
ncbi:MAG: hypothetical protein JWO05_1171 [Gemmatimonadetes bacterium]|nr:hypothetical protein [Gemmatimonadota bacterium]